MKVTLNGSEYSSLSLKITLSGLKTWSNCRPILSSLNVLRK
jgi:hypothetical protein